MTKQLTELKNALLALKPTGAAGFEGFVRIVLTALTGIPFRLAKSGLQGGVDGDSALEGDAVSFEAKRYSGDIHRNEVLTKIADFVRNTDAPDRLWILGATTEISAQLSSAIREDGNRQAVSTLILDWTDEPLPLLAVAAVAAGDPAIDFLTSHCDPKSNRKVLAQVFEDISKHPCFGSVFQKLKSNLNVSALATARAIDANKEWRGISFGSENIARERLGQALSVSSHSDVQSLRKDMQDRVRANLQQDQSVVLSGGEGHGKSWLAAQICWGHEGLALFTSAEQFEGVSPMDLDEHLIDLLIKQTGNVSDETNRIRWRHRLAAWQDQSWGSSLLVVVDGINQRQSLRWDRILNGLHDRLRRIGGHLIVTVRPQFWQKTVASGITFKPKLIAVPEWSTLERNKLLQHYGISLEWLDEATLQTLQNPRLLGVAVATLPLRESIAWKGLTTDRILMEHLRASQRENFEEEALATLTERISHHAKDVLERVRLSSKEPPQNFEADSNSVIETRFFQTLPGPGNIYELRNEGLTLALGYALIDQLWQAQRSGLDVGQQTIHLIDPIHAMDRTVDVMFAALMVCSLDPNRFDQTIFGALLDAFSNLQNIDDQRFEEFVEVVKNQPKELFGVLGDFALERGKRLNQDWFTHASFIIAATDEGWSVAETFIHRWLRCYNKNAVEQMSRYPKVDEDEEAKRLQSRQEKIEEVLSALSPFERDLLEQMTEVEGETDSLFNLALQLIAGRPLEGFASSFIALGLGFSLDGDTWSSRKTFRQLTTFNRVDREATKDAFLKVIEPLQSPATSSAGQWTIVRMLHATGDEAAAKTAYTLAQKLRRNPYSWVAPSPNEWRQSPIADPDAQRPSDLDEGLQNFLALPENKILQAMGQSGEDLYFRDFLPAGCRFEPDITVEKTRQIISGLLERTGTPLRQLIFNGIEYTPLITRDIVIQLIERVADTNMVETLLEKEQNNLRMFLFSYAAPHLTASEQLDCLTGTAFGTDCLLDVIPSLKHQPSDAILAALQVAVEASDEEAAYGALTAAYYGNTPVTSELESLMLRFGCAESSKLRSLYFELAIYRDLKKLRDAHVQSNWAAHRAGKRSYEDWFGSILLVEAYTKEEIDLNEMLERIAPETWFAAANHIGGPVAKSLAACFLRRLLCGVGAVKDLAPPAVDFTLILNERTSFPLLSVDAADRDEGRFPREKTLQEILTTDDDFDEMQKCRHEIADAFFAGLKDSDARLFVEYLTLEDLKRLISDDSTVLPQILEILEQANSSELMWLKNLSFVAANLVSKDMPDKAVALFQQALDAQGFVTFALGDGLSLEHETIWSSAPSKLVDNLWRQRLLQSGNDEVLAREVLAAERFGARDFIRAFVKEHANSVSSLDQAYAITIAGFSTQYEDLVGVINDHIDDKGIIGEAARKAKAAHETARHADKWLADLCAAQSLEEFWNCLIILKTCMDARVSTTSILQSNWSQYAPIFRKVRSTAIDKQNKVRKKTLLAQEAPEGIFITGF